MDIFAHDIFKCIYTNENMFIVSEISLKFISNGQIINNPASVQMMACCLVGVKPLSEATMAQWAHRDILHSVSS